MILWNNAFLLACLVKSASNTFEAMKTTLLTFSIKNLTIKAISTVKNASNTPSSLRQENTHT